MSKRGLFYGKKALVEHNMLVMIVEFVTAAIILGVLLYWVNDIATNKSFDKNVIVRDVSLLTSTITSSPGNIFYEYKINDPFIFDFTSNKAKIATKEDQFPVFYPYRNNKLLKSEFKTPQPTAKLYFSKENNEFKINTQQKPTLDKINCPKIKTTKPNSFGIDPLELSTQEDLTLNIANSLTSYLDRNSDIRMTRDIGVTRDINELKDSELIIGIRANQLSDKNYLKAYYSLASNRAQQSNKLGCYILNEILTYLNFEGSAVIGINPQHFTNQDQEIILDNNKVAIILEIGTIKTDEGLNILRNNQLPNFISKGITNYYQND